MPALALVWRADWRSRWRSWLAVALLAGMAGGIVLASLAGARRTGSALERFSNVTRAPDAFAGVTVDAGSRPDPERIAELRALPEVDAVGVFSTFWIAPAGLSREEQGLFVATAAADEVFTHDVAAPIVLEGRRADSKRAGEIDVNEDLAERLGIGPGDDVVFESFTPEQLAAGEATGAFVEPSGPRLELTVTAIVRSGSDILRESPGTRDTFPVLLTPAFADAHTADIGNRSGSMVIRLRDGAADFAGFTDEMRRIYRGSEIFISGTGGFSPGERNAFDVPRGGLLVLAGAVAIAGLVVAGQAVTRQVLARGFDDGVLSALGMSRWRRLFAAVGTTVPVAVAGAAAAAAIAVAASPLFPFGTARRGEPDPGLAVDGVVLGAGVLAIIVVLLLVALLSGWRLVRVARATSDSVRAAQPSGPQRFRAGWIPLTTVIGVRMALAPGRGRTAVPVRPALVAAAVGALGVVGALVVASSLDRASADPARYGWNWDLAVDAGAGRARAAELSAALAGDRAVDTVAVVEVAQIPVGGSEIPAQAFRSVSGAISPTIVKGRAPLVPGEVALGVDTMADLDLEIGRTVELRGLDGDSTYDVVGQAILPVLDADTPEEGAVFAGDLPALRPEERDPIRSQVIVVTLRAGADQKRVVDRWERDGLVVMSPQRPRAVSNLRELATLPFFLAAALATLAIGSVLHALVTGVRRRNRDLAVLGALGLDDRQLERVVRWQAVTIVAIGLVAGIPLGLAAGRWVWSTIAANTGLAGDPSFPVAWLVATAVAGLIAAVVVALVPGYLATRIPLAATLRTE